MLYDKIKKLCVEKGISITKLEKECELGNATIRRWESSTPNVNTLKKLANYFQVPVTYFLEYKREEG